MDEPRFQALRERWNTLADMTDSQSVFLRHEWFAAAWQWRKHDSALRLLCVYGGGKLIGICPLVVQRARRYGMPVRTLEFLTVPDTQICDLLTDTADRSAVAEAVAEALMHAPFHWDMFRPSYLGQDSAGANELRAALARRDARVELRAAHVNLFIGLAGGWKAFYAERSRRLKKANNYIANRITRTGSELEVSWLWGSAANDAAAVERTLAAAIEISSRSWKNQTGKSLDTAHAGGFIRALTVSARENGWLSLWLLSLDAKPIAMEYQLIYRGEVYALRADYDQAFHELSPGSYLNRRLLEQLFDAHCSRYWLGPGENTYKLHWTNSSTTLFEVVAFGRTLRGRLLGMLSLYVVPTLKKWFKRPPTNLR